MTKNFINKVTKDYNNGKECTLHGKYAYTIQYNCMANKNIIIRCDKRFLNYDRWEWTDTIVNYQTLKKEMLA